MLIIRSYFDKIRKLKTKVEFVFYANIDEFESIDPLVFSQMLECHGQLVFSGDLIKKEVEKAMKDRTIGVNEKGKSPSQIMRGVLYNVALKKKLDGEIFYKEEMNKIIEHYKKKYLNG